MKQIRVLLLAILCAVPIARAAGQDYITTRWVYLRRTPSNTVGKIRVLPPAESLSARTVPPRCRVVAATRVFLPSVSKDGGVGQTA